MRHVFDLKRFLSYQNVRSMYQKRLSVFVWVKWLTVIPLSFILLFFSAFICTLRLSHIVHTLFIFNLILYFFYTLFFFSNLFLVLYKLSHIQFILFSPSHFILHFFYAFPYHFPEASMSGEEWQIETMRLSPFYFLSYSFFIVA